MGDYSVNRLLALASLFETTAEEKLKETDSLIADNLGASDSFVREIHFLVKIYANTSQWMSWIESNKTALGSLVELSWNTYNSTTIYTHGTKSSLVYITTKLEPPKQNLSDFDITFQAVLKASSPFPTLRLFAGYVVNKTTPLSPELSHDQWLIDSLQEIVPDSSFDYDEFKIFFKKNKPTIDKIRGLFKSVPKALGSGSDGIVFDIQGDKILKIFKDPVAFTKAMEAMHRLHNEPLLAKTEAMIYDAGRLGNFLGTDIYYYIMEKMEPVRQFDEDATSGLQDIIYIIRKNIEKNRDSKWQILKSKINNKKYHSRIKQEVAKEATLITQILIEDSDLKSDVEKGISNLNKTWLQSFVEEILMKYLTGRTDLHIGNLGVTGYGELRYFDPSFSDWTSNINI
jgi:hypothetical protein